MSRNGPKGAITAALCTPKGTVLLRLLSVGGEGGCGGLRGAGPV